jgi:uncharacterized Rossmann fold enzyme
MAATKTIDLTQKLQVQYCIPIWLRDLQIAQNISRIAKRIQPGPLRDGPIAVVGFGPSLNDTWQDLRRFDHIITCSGAHRFLLDRGLVPTWHVDVDPREHKVQLLGAPDPRVHYLAASTCHPKYFDHLEGFDVALWHVFDATEEAQRVLPPGEWALTGGSSAGLRALTIARFLGFRDLHVFGMDGSEGTTGKHAAAHPNQAPDHATTIYNGVEYRTTTSMAECAKQTFHELDQLKDCTATFYGDGLVQAMAKDYQPKHPAGAVFLGMSKPELISAGYRDLNAQLHRDNLFYGVGGGKHAATVLKLADRLQTRSILDYGCGKGALAKALPFPIWEYDPAIPSKAEAPRPADLVICTDVLEHIEPDMLPAVIADLRRCTKRIAYLVIHSGPSTKLLADGRNAHLLQEGQAWWTTQLARVFTVGKCLVTGPLLHFVVEPRAKTKAA